MAEIKNRRVHLRVAARDDGQFRAAAAAANESLSEFLVSGRERVEWLLGDRTRLVLSPGAVAGVRGGARARAAGDR
jgi:uncharacterized protein (DUF1778 family)